MAGFNATPYTHGAWVDGSVSIAVGSVTELEDAARDVTLKRAVIGELFQYAKEAAGTDPTQAAMYVKAILSICASSRFAFKGFQGLLSDSLNLLQNSGRISAPQTVFGLTINLTTLAQIIKRYYIEETKTAFAGKNFMGILRNLAGPSAGFAEIL